MRHPTFLALFLSFLVALAHTAYTQEIRKQVLNNEAKNFIIVLVDDMGFSDLGCYGAEIPTPNLDALAANGTAFRQFYNNARCCPSRASLLTGCYSHRVGMGHMNGRLGSNPAYQGHLSQSQPTVAEVLAKQGYATYMSGKWHVGDDSAHWACRRGFNQHMGMINGAGHYYSYKPIRKRKDGSLIPQTYVDNCCRVADKPSATYFTHDITQYAVQRLKYHKQKKGQQPFFMYVAYTAPHWPLQAPEATIQKMRKLYAKATPAALRQARFQKQKKLGFWADSIKTNDAGFEREPSPTELSQFREGMAVYAAMVVEMDRGIGQILSTLKAQRQDKNTVVLFLSDNGASAEEPQSWDATIKPEPNVIGKPESMASYGPWGAWVSNTPFRGKKADQYEGGIATPAIMAIPRRKTARKTDGYIRHIIDVMPMTLMLANTPPDTVESLKLDGRSFGYWVGKTQPIADAYWDQRLLCWEHEGNRAVRRGQYKLVSLYAKPWELYDMYNDPTERRNLAGTVPELVQELAAEWDKWAAYTGATPDFKALQLDWNKIK